MADRKPNVPVEPPEERKVPFLLLVVVTIASLVLSDMPVFSIIYSPIQTFTTALHEIGHALFCSLTGGSVTGMTIVSDGAGHGGLTFGLGGSHFIYGQTGYLGTTLFGCIMLWLGRRQSFTRPVLVGLGVLLLASVFFYMMPGLYNKPEYSGQIMSSMVIGVLMAAALFAGAKWLPLQVASLVLLFLGVQTALNALHDIVVLAQITLGMHGPASFSDATNMAQETGIPAIVWSFFWGLSSLAMLGMTIKLAYGKGK